MRLFAFIHRLFRKPSQDLYLAPLTTEEKSTAELGLDVTEQLTGERTPDPRRRNVYAEVAREAKARLAAAPRTELATPADWAMLAKVEAEIEAEFAKFQDPAFTPKARELAPFVYQYNSEETEG